MNTLAPSSTDIDRVTWEMNRTFNPLHREFVLDYHVTAVKDGYVLLTIALPEGLTRAFSSMLENLGMFFRFMAIKEQTATAQAKTVDPAELHRRQERNDSFTADVLEIFDGFIAAGLDAKEATKRTNFALKEKSCPWATYEIVAGVIRSAGRYRRQKGGIAAK